MTVETGNALYALVTFLFIAGCVWAGFAPAPGSRAAIKRDRAQRDATKRTTRLNRSR